MADVRVCVYRCERAGERSPRLDCCDGVCDGPAPPPQTTLRALDWDFAAEQIDWSEPDLL